MASYKGKRMMSAVRFVTSHPGCFKAHAVNATGLPPNEGYQAVNRAIKAGFISQVAAPEGRHHYRLYPERAR